MPREPDLDSPAAAGVLYVEAGDCLSDVPAAVLEDVAAYHAHAEPPTTVVDESELV